MLTPGPDTNLSWPGGDLCVHSPVIDGERHIKLATHVGSAARCSLMPRALKERPCCEALYRSSQQQTRTTHASNTCLALQQSLCSCGVCNLATSTCIRYPWGQRKTYNCFTAT